jgi:hypothetical protein
MLKTLQTLVSASAFSGRLVAISPSTLQILTPNAL